MLAGAVALLAARSPDDALGQIAASSGHASLVHVRATATRVVEGRTVTITFDQLGVTRLVERCVAGACDGTWFDGDRRWTFGINRVPLPDDADAATRVERTLAAIASYAFAEPSFRAAGGTVEPAGGARWRVRARDGEELIAVLDAGGAVERVEMPSGIEVAAYSGEVRTGGARFAVRRSGDLEPGDLDAAAAVAEPLAKPHGPDVAFAGDAAARLGDAPVPVVPCTIAGHAEHCLIDTGATPSAVTLGVAEAVGLEPHGELELSGLGRFATGFIETGPLVVGSATFARAKFAVIPAAPSGIDAVIGSDLLGVVRVAIDRERHTVRLAAPGGPPAPGTAVDLGFRRGSPRVSASLDGGGDRALLDTGDEAVVSFGYARYRDGPPWRVVGRGQAVGIGGGADDTLLVQVPNARVGTLALGPTRAVVRRTQTETHVGIGLWSRFRIDLDEAAGRIVFSPP